MKNVLPWTNLYVPKNTGEIFGQDEPLKDLNTFIYNYKREKKKAALVFGPPGCGKTSSVYAIGKEAGYEIMELNASDFRNKDSINSVLGNALGQVSLFAKSKIILVDEIEGLSGTKDRGGLQALTKLIEKSPFPIVLTVQDAFDQKLSSLRKKCKLVEFNILSYGPIYENLRRVADSEGIEFEDTILKSLARRAGGDMRAALNDLQMLSGISKRLTREDLEFLSEREQKESITSAVSRIFKTTNAGIALEALDNVDEDMDKLFLWLDENIGKEYTKPEDLARAYNMISKADVYKRRIRRLQHWRFMVYIFALLSAGVATAKDEKYKNVIELKQSQRPLKIYIANMKYQKRKSIAQKISEKSSGSSRVIMQNMPYIQAIIRNNKRMGSEIASEFELEKEEISWLKK